MFRYCPNSDDGYSRERRSRSRSRMSRYTRKYNIVNALVVVLCFTVTVCQYCIYCRAIYSVGGRRSRSHSRSRSRMILL